MLESETQIRIRFADCDPMGHVNNAVYFTYMEQARVELFKKVFTLKEGPIKPEHFPFIIAEISCQFLKPSLFDQTLNVSAEIVEIKNSSFIILYESTDARSGEVVSTGRSVQVWYDYNLQKSRPIPENFRKIMEG